MKSLALAALLAAAAFAAPTAADAATLRPQATVDDSLVRLGDLFDDLGIGADIAVAHAPPPGRRITFDTATLIEIARAYRISWRPQSRFDRVVVERSGRIIQKQEIVAHLADALKADGMRHDAEIEIVGRAIEIAVPMDASNAIEIRNLSFDRQSGRFSAVVMAGGGSTSAQRLSVSGKVHETAAVPVLRRAVSPGEVIRKDDVEVVRIREDRARGDIIADPQRLIGTTPRFRLRAHEPVRESDTRPPRVVTRNSTVTITLRTGSMILTAQGRASEDGAKGDTISVVNLQSKKTIEAVVSGPDQVTIYPGNHVAVN